MSKPKNDAKSGIIMIIIGAALIIGASIFLNGNNNKINKGALPALPDAPIIEGAMAKAQNDISPASGTEVETIPAFDLKAALKERILGNPDADIKISEHSSLTCGHCGAFHREVFADFKTAYIDSGKAYLVYSDFPLNAPALHASMAARCLPEDKFFDFTSELFAKQDDWAYAPTYMDKLEALAKPYGLSGKAFDACVKNEALRDGLVKRQQAAGEQWKVRSTPTFVINNKITISGGSHDFMAFDKRIQDAIKESE